MAYIGDYMKVYAEKNKLLTTFRRTLLRSYKGQKILLTTS